MITAAGEDRAPASMLIRRSRCESNALADGRAVRVPVDLSGRLILAGR
jgi:hypothetical protein